MRVSAPLFRLRVTITYLALAIASSIFLSQLRPHAQWHVLREASTNLHNLSDGHIATLVASVFLTDGEVNWLWLASVVALFAVAEWVSGSKRFLWTFLLGHIGATALVAIGLFVGIHANWLADSLAMAIDVGVSYAAAAVAGSLIRYLYRSWRIAWAVGWTALVAVAAISDPTFTAFGHIAALAIGFTLGAYYIRADSIAKDANTFDAASTEPPQQDTAMTTLMSHEHR
ncbi:MULTISPECIES: rhomboid-like protein [unclassified Rhodococcus (in: high G+C Gram-positive bacteria)]|uniref:rhomboid-like protein n=1 Tax=unclassified Rhodococcus (in: high G+C Gram-positive bacteria) TaxID=192944 RepID=UPI00339515D6